MPSANYPAKVAYDREHYKTIGVYLRRDDAKLVEDAAANRGISTGELLRQLLRIIS